MMDRILRTRTWTVLAFALLILGIGRANLNDGISADRLISILMDPAIGTIALLAAGLAALWLNWRVVSLMLMLAAAVPPGAEIAAGPSSLPLGPRLASELAPAVLGIVLVLGVVSYRLPLPVRWRFSLSASLFLGVAMLGVVSLLAFESVVGSVADELAHAAKMLGFLALSCAWLDYIVRNVVAERESVIRWLGLPIAFAGCCGAAAVCAFLIQIDGLSGNQRLGLMLVTSVVALWLIAAALAGTNVYAAWLRLGRAQDRLRAMVRRQRRILRERKLQLRQARVSYESLFHGVPAPVVLTKPDGEVLAGNVAMLDFLGLGSEEELRTRNFSSFYADAEQREQLLEAWHAAESDLHQGELRMKRVNGEQRTVLYALRTVRLPDRSIDFLQGTITDISDLRRAQAEREKLELHLRLSQKLESVGRLAAGIAHEINTPMQYIGDNVYFLKESFASFRELLEEEGRLLESADALSAAEIRDHVQALQMRLELKDTLELTPRALERAEQGIRSVSQIVSAMKELAHPGQGAKASTNINDLIETALTVTRNAYKTVAAVEQEFGDVPYVLTYKNELCQVLINLIVNAAHAIETAKESGRIDGVIRIRTWGEGSDVCICVEDNGCGIPDAALEKIFDPFFTTKDVGKGTGQGLAIARATVVDQHGGALEVESTVGSGTTFVIKIPVKASGEGADTRRKEAS